MSWIASNRLRREPAGTARREAQAWVVRLASGRVTASEAESFRHWHALDPAHAKAFAEAKLHWEVVGTAAEELGAQPVFTPGRKHAFEAPSTRRWFLGAGLAATAAGAGIILVRPPFGLWSPAVDFGADYRTGIGERRKIDFAQGATVELTTRSRLALKADHPDGVRVALLSGEAAISAETRPVTVVAGPGEVRVVQGRFDLRADADAVRVTCLAGSVDVACGGRRVRVDAGRQIRYGDRGIGTAEAVDPEAIMAWQRGVLIFHNQPLGHVIEEVNRYRPGRIILTNPDLARRPVAVANFHLDQLDEVVPQIEALYGAHARHLPGGIVLLG